jgi:hypothetical protein
MAHDGVGLQMCYRRVCGSTPGDWDSNNAVLALSLRRCRTTAYTSSAVPRFTDMLLSPHPFGSRSVVRLGVMSPELRPPLVAIPSVRDTAHSFPASGSSVVLVSAVQSRAFRQTLFDASTRANGHTARMSCASVWAASIVLSNCCTQGSS